MFAIDDQVKLVSPADDLHTDDISNQQLKNIFAAVGTDDVGTVVSILTGTGEVQFISVSFPIYGGVFSNLPAAFLEAAGP